MTIHQGEIIDYIGVDKSTDQLVLSIIDDADESIDCIEHIDLLKNKLNSYMHFINSGQNNLNENYANREVIISIFLKSQPAKKVEQFLIDVGSHIRGLNIEFKYQVID